MRTGICGECAGAVVVEADGKLGSTGVGRKYVEREE